MSARERGATALLRAEGGAMALAMAFIAWDLGMSGNSTFVFNYSDADFARPKDYGLVQ